ncbi:hypothetical protein WH50_10040 [Pokkaliibacter plantistimulans]|uniref:DUF3828 domain-containing protein n=1 Tax=Pokkaliibacter plantistimulans TaxID=1635171 RepID=A0ABX5M1N3_9GAMM|nr:hypothetical protein [Pokkaliibacter plantistimulans]PXF31408.1 hypothetical protein WH50_10040 [Pokkaliibacter plantistimulans]
MMHILLSFLFSLFVATNSYADQPSPLLDAFNKFSLEVNESNAFEKGPSFFTKEFIKEAQFSKDPDVNEKSLLRAYTMHEMVKKRENSFEMQEKGSALGCLTINGYNSTDEPLSIFILYKNSESHWLVSQVHVEFLNEGDAFTDHAQCPQEVM